MIRGSVICERKTRRCRSLARVVAKEGGIGKIPRADCEVDRLNPIDLWAREELDRCASDMPPNSKRSRQPPIHVNGGEAYRPRPRTDFTGAARRPLSYPSPATECANNARTPRPLRGGAARTPPSPSDTRACCRNRSACRDTCRPALARRRAAIEYRR